MFTFVINQTIQTNPTNITLLSVHKYLIPKLNVSRFGVPGSKLKTYINLVTILTKIRHTRHNQFGEKVSQPRLMQDPRDMSCVRFFNPER